MVSEKFAKQYGTDFGIFGTFLIDDRLDSDKALALLDKTVGRKNAIVMGLSKNLTQSVSVVAMPFAAVILVMIAGYLLIYNVVNISVLQEMHMYGQLKTLGATTIQLKSIVKRQSNMVALIGILLGLLLGTIIFLSCCSKVP